MFRLKIGTNMDDIQKIESLDLRILEALTKYGVSTAGATISLNGRILDAGDLDRTFAEMGIQPDGSANLIAVVKATSAC